MTGKKLIKMFSLKPSIKTSLFFFLTITILLIASIITSISYYLDTRDIHSYFDHQLIETNHFLSAMLIPHADQEIQFANIQKYINQRDKVLHKNKHALKFSQKFLLQIWNKKENILLKSKLAPSTPLTKQIGFSKQQIQDTNWRIYTHYEPVSHLTVAVAEPYYVRNHLERQIVMNILIILLWMYPLFALLIWISIHFSLKKLNEITETIARKKPTDFTSIEIANIPSEVEPLISELNNLFLRLEDTFERNRRFAADAAHELRTPLAALKTQIQVALLVKEKNEQKQMFDRIIPGINRCTHVVQQLLALSRLDQKSSFEKNQVHLSKLATEIISQIAPMAIDKQIDLEFVQPKNNDPIIQGNEITLGILIRNLLDNAIRYTPKKGKVTLKIETSKKRAILQVSDTGPGIPKNLQKQIFERFYRVLGTKTTGSGLGLAIVAEIVKLHQAKIKLKKPKKETGLIVEVEFQLVKN